MLCAEDVNFEIVIKEGTLSFSDTATESVDKNIFLLSREKHKIITIFKYIFYQYIFILSISLPSPSVLSC